MKCLACKASYRPGARKCDRCSAPLPPSCAHCGAPVAAGAELCERCTTESPAAVPGPAAMFPGATHETTQVATAPFPLLPDFVGQKDATDQLWDAHRRARERLSFTLVVGAPGTGKTRLVSEFVRQLGQTTPKARVFRGEAGARAALPYGSFVGLLSERFGITQQEQPDHAREKIIANVGDVLPSAQVAEISHLLAHLLGVEFADSAIVEQLAEQPKRLEARIFLAVKRFLAADAAGAPLILCIDNVERAERETVNLLHYLAAGLRSAPVMVIAMARPTLFDVHPTFGEGDVAIERIQLAPLSDEEADLLLRNLLKPAGEVPASLFDSAKRLGGVPRTRVELVRLLLEANVIVRDHEGKTPTGWSVEPQALAQLKMPKKHEDVLAQRLKHMSEVERKLLERAAACGEVFWLDAVVALARSETLANDDPDGPTLAEISKADDTARVAVADGLSKLVERGWVAKVGDSEMTGEHEYRFAYPPLWDVVYDAMKADVRQRYHHRVAQWLQLRPDGRGEPAQEEVGRHLERAGKFELAAARYRRAADGARARFRNERAIRLYAQALSCLGNRDLAARIHLWHDLGSVYELKGDLEAALGAFERMLRLTWVASSRTKAAVAFNKMGRVWRRKGDLKLAVDYLQRGLELFEQSGDSRGVAGSLDDLGMVMWLLGHYDEAFEKITLGLQHRGKGGDKRSIARSLANLGNLQMDRGFFDEAQSCHREALQLSRDTGDRAGVVSSLNALAVLAFERADFASARTGWENALVEAEAIGALALQSTLLNNLGELALLDGKNEEARRRLEDARDMASEIDEKRMVCEATRNLGRVELKAGNLDKAKELAENSFALAESSGLRDYAGRALLALGEIAAATLFDDRTTRVGKRLSAEEYFQRGVDLFRELGNESELAKGLEQFARYRLERSDKKRGAPLLQEAHELFRKLGMRPDVDLQKLV